MKHLSLLTILAATLCSTATAQRTGDEIFGYILAIHNLQFSMFIIQRLIHVFHIAGVVVNILRAEFNVVEVELGG